MKNLKKRALSWLLALALVLGMVPATVLPQAEALTFQTSELTINADGSFEVTFTRENEFVDLVNWVLLIAPNVSFGNKTNNQTPYEVYSGQSLASLSEFETFIKAMCIPAGTYYTDSGSSKFPDANTGGKQVTFKGSVPGNHDAVKTALTAAGTDTDLSNGIPYVAILYSSAGNTGGEKGLTADTAVMPPKRDELTATPINITVTGSGESYSASGTTSTITNIGNVDVILEPVNSEYKTDTNKNTGFAINTDFNTNLNQLAVGTMSGYTTIGDEQDGNKGIVKNNGTATLTFDWLSGSEFTWSTYASQYANSTGTLYVNYHTTNDSKTKTLAIPVTITLENTPVMTPEKYTVVYNGTVESGGTNAKYTETVPTAIKVNISDWGSYASLGTMPTMSPGDSVWTVTWTDDDGSDCTPSEVDGYVMGEVSAGNTYVTLSISPPVSVTLTGEGPTYTFTETYTVAYSAIDNDGEAGTLSYFDITMIANLTVEGTTYKVSYKTGVTDSSVTGTMADQRFSPGTAQTLTPNGFSRAGYRFVNWLGNDGKTYSDKALITLDGDLELTAQWQQVHAIKFNANGGAGTMSDVVVDAGSSATLPANSFTYSGYSFDGWNTVAGGTGTTYADGDTVTPSGDMTLYAQWKQDVDAGSVKITVKFDDGEDSDNNGSGLTMILRGSGDGAVDIPLTDNNDGTYTSTTVPVGTGYKIMVQDENGNYEETGETIDVEKDKESTRTLEYYYITVTPGTGAVAATTPITLVSGDELTGSGWYKKGSVVTLDVDPNTADNYSDLDTDLTWSLAITESFANNLSGNFTISGNNLTVNETITATGNYALKKFNLIYSANGGSGSHDPETYSYGDTVAVKAVGTGDDQINFSKGNAIFIGWGTTSTGGISSDYEAGDTFNIQNDTTLYAHWLTYAGETYDGFVYNTADTTGKAINTGTSTVTSANLSYTLDGIKLGSAATNDSGLSLNDAKTHIVYDGGGKPGTYTVTITVSDGTNSKTVDWTIKVKKAEDGVELQKVSDPTTPNTSTGSIKITSYKSDGTYKVYQKLPGASSFTEITSSVTIGGDGTIGSLPAGTYYVSRAEDDYYTYTDSGEVTLSDPTEGSIKVTVNLDGNPYADLDSSGKVYLSADTSLDGTNTQLTYDSTNKVYTTTKTFAAGAAGTDYYVFINGKQVGSVKITAGGTATPVYDYYSVSVVKNGDGVVTDSAKIADDPSSNYYRLATDVDAFLKGTTVTLEATLDTGKGYAAPLVWTLDPSAGSGGQSSVTGNTLTVNDKVEATGNYTPNKVTVTLKVNGQLAATGYTVELKPGTGSATTLTNNGGGTYSTSVVNDGTYTIVVTDSSVTTNTVNWTTAVTVSGGSSHTVEVELFTVEYEEFIAVDNNGLNPTNVMITPTHDSDGGGGNDSIEAVTATYVVGGGDVADGQLVCEGTEVKFDLTSGAHGLWGTNDYYLNWTSGASALTSNIANNASTKTQTVKYDQAHDEIAATLKLNLYTVTINHQASHLNEVSLKDNYGNDFSATGTPIGTGATVFTNRVPKGSYTLSATAYGTDVSVVGYNTTATTVTAPNNSGSPEVTTASVALDVEGNTTAAVVTAEAKYAIQLSDNGGTNWTADNTGLPSDWTDVEYGYTYVTKTVTIKNTGNRTLYNLAVTNENGGVFLLNSTDQTTGEDDTTPISLAPGITTTFTVTFPAGQNANANDYTDTFTITATKETATNSDAFHTGGVTYTPAQTVNKAPITVATVTDISPAPAVGGTPDNEAAVTATGAGTGGPLDGGATTATVTWVQALDSGKFAAGVEYTARVELTADSNHYFDDSTYQSGYTIVTATNGTAGTTYKGKATVDASDDGTKLTLTYTFPPTKPTGTVGLTATDWFKAIAEPDNLPTANGDVVVYYALIKTDDLDNVTEGHITADAIKGGSTGGTPIASGTWLYGKGDSGSNGYSYTYGATTSANDALKPYTDYTVYAFVEVTGETTGEVVASDLLGPATDITYHKVTVKVKDGQTNEGKITAPTDTGNDDIEIVGVEHGKTLSIAAAVETGVNDWQFKTWAISESGGSIANALTDKAATYTADGTAKEVTIIAEFEQGYTIEYLPNYTGAPTNTNKMDDEALFFLADGVDTDANPFDRDGYEFIGWSIVPDLKDNPTLIKPDDTADDTSDAPDVPSEPDSWNTGFITIQQIVDAQEPEGTELYLYAQWKAIEPTLTLTGFDNAVYGTKVENNTSAVKVSMSDKSTPDAGWEFSLVDAEGATANDGNATSDNGYYGFEIDSGTGALTYQPRTTTALLTEKNNGTETKVTLTVKVVNKDTGASATGTLVVGVKKADPALSITGYNVGKPNYTDDALDPNKVIHTVTAPWWNETEQKWADPEIKPNGSLVFDSSYNNKVGADGSYKLIYDVTDGTDGRAVDSYLYNDPTGSVTINVTAKSYSLDLREADEAAETLDKDLTLESTYLDEAEDITPAEFLIKNTGNQKLSFANDTATYHFGDVTDASGDTVTGEHAPVFAIVADSIFIGDLDGGVTTDGEKPIKVTVTNPHKVFVGTYTVALTVTGSDGDNELTDPNDAVTIVYTVEPKGITAAEVSGLVDPAPGGTPVSAVTKGDYILANGETVDIDKNSGKDGNDVVPYTATVGWAPNDGTFKAGTDYTATVTLTADENYYFVNDAANNATNYVVKDNAGTPAKVTMDNVTVDEEKTAGGGSVTLVKKYDGGDVAPPKLSAWATSYDTGKYTVAKNDDNEDTDEVKYLFTTDGNKPNADALWKNTNSVQLTDDPTEVNPEDLSPNTTYYIYAVARVGEGNYSDVTTAKFKTPYAVTVTTNGNGTASFEYNGTQTVDGDSVNTDVADYVTVGLYGGENGEKDSNDNKTASGAEEVVIPWQITLAAEPDDDTKYAFDEWALDPTDGGTFTGGSDTTNDGGVNVGRKDEVYTPAGNDGEIEVTAKFEKIYTIVFNENGGTGGEGIALPATINGVRLNVATKLPATTGSFTRTGYEHVNAWALDTGGTDTRVTFGGDLTLTEALVARVDSEDTQTITVYHVWESKELSVAHAGLSAIYNMDQDEWKADNTHKAPTAAVTVNGGSGNYKYELVPVNDGADDDPTDFLTIGGDGIIRLFTSSDSVGAKRMGDVGTYLFKVKVTDTTKNEAVESDEIKLVVHKSTPIIVDEANVAAPTRIEYTYAGDDGTGDKDATYSFHGDTVIWDQEDALTGTLVRDPYDDSLYLFNIGSNTNKGEWSANPASFDGEDGTKDKPKEADYTFKFTVTETSIAGNYNTVEAVKKLNAIERDPNIAVNGDAQDPPGYGLNVTETVTVTYNETYATTITVKIMNTGNTAFQTVEVNKTTPSGSIATLGDLSGVTQNLGDTKETQFTFTIPAKKDVGTYTETFSVTGTTAQNAKVTATYTYVLVVEHATAKPVAVTVTAPVAGEEPNTTATLDAPKDNTVVLANQDGVTAKWTGTLDGEGKFKPGETYTATVIVNPADNYILPTADGNYTMNTVVAGTGSTSNPKVVRVEGGTQATLTYTWTLPANKLEVEAHATGYDEGVFTATITSATEPTVYYLVLPADADAPDAAKVKADGDTLTVTDQNNGTYKSAADVEIPDTMITLLPYTKYVVYVVAETGTGVNAVLSDVGSNELLTWYKVNVSVSDGGTIKASDNLLGANGLAGADSTTIGLEVLDPDHDDFDPNNADPASVEFTADPTVTADIGGWAVYGWKYGTTSAGTDVANAPTTYEHKPNGEPETSVHLQFHKVIEGAPHITSSGTDGKLEEDATLYAHSKYGGTQYTVIGDDGTLDFGNNGYDENLTYEWFYGKDSTWTKIEGKTTTSFDIPDKSNDDKHTYAGYQFKFVATYKGDPDKDDGFSTVEQTTDVFKPVLDAPEVVLEGAGDPGGLKMTLTKSEDDEKQADGSNRIKEYIVYLYEGTDTTDSTKMVLKNPVTITANGSATYDLSWALLNNETSNVKGNLDPTKTYTVVVKTTPGDDYVNKYTAPKDVSDDDSPDLIQLTEDDLKVEIEDVTYDGKSYTVGTYVTVTPVSGITASHIGTVTVTAARSPNGTQGTEWTDVNMTTGQNGKHTVFITVADGTYYKGLTFQYDDDNNEETPAGWAILQAPTTLTHKTRIDEKTGQTVVLADPNRSVTYEDREDKTSADQDGVAPTSSTVTTTAADKSYFTYTYTVKSAPEGSKISGELGESFVPDVKGDYVITVTAEYFTGNADDQYQADVAEPAPVEITVHIDDKLPERIELLNDINGYKATTEATFGVPVGTYMDGLDSNDGDHQMDRHHLTVRVHYDDGSSADFVVDKDPLPGGLEWIYSANSDGTGDATTIAGEGEDFHINFKPDTTGTVYLDVKLGELVSENHVPFTLNKANWTVHVDVENLGTDDSPKYGGKVRFENMQDFDVKETKGFNYPPTQEFGIEAKADTGYVFDKWVMVDSTGAVVTGDTYGVIGDPKLAITTFKPAKDGMTARAIFKQVDYLMVFDDSITTPTNPDASERFERYIEATDDRTPPSNYTVTLGNDGGPLTNVSFSAKEYLNDNEVALNTWFGYTLPDTIGTFVKDEGKEIPLDLSKIKEPGTYKLVITASGKDERGGTVTATYTVVVNITLGKEPVIMFSDKAVDGTEKGPDEVVTRVIEIKKGESLPYDKIDIYLNAYFNQVYDVVIAAKYDGTNMTTNSATVTPVTFDGDPMDPNDVDHTYTVNLENFDTSKVGTYTLTLTARGFDADNKLANTHDTATTYILTIRVKSETVITPTPTPPAEEETCPFHVFYWIGLNGVTDMPTAEMVEEGAKPVAVPNIMANTGYEFKGWSLTKPVEGEEPVLVDPATVTITEDTVFYAVYEELEVAPTTIFHEHYVIGYPDGTFGPADDITRGSVATIIARAILPGFVEGADYGNPGGYLDVEGHWAESAIAYCSIYGVFKGYDDGNFYPDKPITRQEFALVIARLNGVQPNQGVPFTDIGDAAFWAMDGIYTSYANGWFNGYLDNTFKPLNNIARSEAVKVFNAYLKRGVDAEGLSEMTEYVHSGTASNNTENGINQYMTWPDVPETYWAYYEIIEAANDHEFHYTGENFDQLPEHWTKCWIDEVWRYHDDPDDGGPAAN